MEKKSATIWIGGAAGDGVASTGEILAKTCSRSGLHYFAQSSYQSVIRGGHVVYQFQTGSEPVYTQGDGFDLMIALNQDSIDYHLNSVNRSAGRGFIFNSDKVKLDPALLPAGAMAYGIPVGDLTAEFGRNPVMQNTLACGVLVYLLGLSWDVFETAIRSQFGKKKAEIADLNVKVAQKGFDYAKSKFQTLGDIQLKGDGQRRMLLGANQAIALGAVAGGCTFYSAYPMTPASAIMHWLAPRSGKYGVVMKQCEDEIASINMAIGAGFSGVRAMTGTSGGGFALMTEALGLAGITEIPVVAVLVQRGGPSTGLPTKTEQGDLFQALGASQGEYPKAILTPITVEDAYHSTIQSLNIAEKYQLPVILLSDLLLSEHMETVDPSALTNKVPIERGDIVSSLSGDDYKRYKDTPSGVSPRVFPGLEGGQHVAASDEHDEDGCLISDIFTNPTTRVKMVQKRFRKMDGLAREVAGQSIVKEGPADADLTLVGWGSTYKTLKNIRLALEKEGVKVNHLQFRIVWPFPADAALKELRGAKKAVMIENNYSGLFAKLLRQETGLSLPHHIRKFDGEPFYFAPLLERVKGLLKPGAPEVQHLVTAELDIAIKRVAVTA
ncbi:MAG: 2-oxoacid:acceptor oxidoreductase subunit alpha [Elusimicrobia bacterium]|nr:2-oxoacid:acceptor oxidoreductase subunit alpha [Elusimicrobiota bacterium]